MSTLQARLGTPGTGPLPPLPALPVPVHATDDAIRRLFLQQQRAITDLTKRALALPVPPTHLRGTY